MDLLPFGADKLSDAVPARDRAGSHRKPPPGDDTAAPERQRSCLRRTSPRPPQLGGRYTVSAGERVEIPGRRTRSRTVDTLLKWKPLWLATGRTSVIRGPFQTVDFRSAVHGTPGALQSKGLDTMACQSCRAVCYGQHTVHRRSFPATGWCQGTPLKRSSPGLSRLLSIVRR